MKINIAIDGPSAAGKSTIADVLAKKLGYTHLDTGAMYRSVAYKAIKEGISVEDEDTVVEMIDKMDLQMNPDGTIVLDGEEISGKIRTSEISMGASNVSKLKNVRKALVKMQQKISANGGYILDGRDIGTVVLPDAPIKLFMIASAKARADRRVKQDLEERGIVDDYDAILEEIEKRDYQDSHRENSPLRKADDAIEIDTSELTLEESIETITKLVMDKMK
ncbi:MAG: (d)CMP kinase [Erysipelotrichaceae bacterium]|nr:(d)CMP kinase [Erysipelotrichaceae bacterium]